MKHWCKRMFVVFALSLPVLAGAQIITFEGVCSPAPGPCPVSTTYVPAGVTFTPSTHNIWGGNSNGNPGNWGIEGTNGPSFLGFNGTPSYQAQLNLARNATFFAVDVTRTNGSTDGSFTLTLFSNATQVFTTTVTLGAINTWQTVSGSVPGGFNIAVLSGAGTAFHPFGVDNIQIGGNCFGFSDVLPSDSFCNATEWLANRGVTLGCAVGLYCPANNVNRAQMALFMNRLGNALTPVQLSQSQAGIVGTFQSRAVGCQTSDFQVTGFPRTASGVASLLFYSASAQKSIDGRVAYSTDGGATWTTPDYFFASAVQPNSYGSYSDVLRPLALEVGRTYRFGVALDDSGYGSNAGATVTVDCELVVRIENRSPTSAPFDPPASQAPASSGPGNR